MKKFIETVVAVIVGVSVYDIFIYPIIDTSEWYEKFCNKYFNKNKTENVVSGEEEFKAKVKDDAYKAISEAMKKTEIKMGFHA